MVNEVAIGTPFWVANSKENEWVKVFIDWINNELKNDPKMSLAEFAKGVDKALVKTSFDLIKRTVDRQFDKE